jgi:hypothetical protein
MLDPTKKHTELFKNIISSSVETMKSYLKVSKEELPMLFKLVLKDNQIVDIPSFLYQRLPSKNLIASLIQRACAEFKPIAVVQICECWYTEEKTIEDYSKNLEKYGSVREMPSSIEGFSIMLSYSRDGKALATTYTAPIIKDSQGNRVLDETRAKENKEVQIGEDSIFHFSPKLLTPVG